jgi:predicted anti-sigma-YlaC factor YlaD
MRCGKALRLASRGIDGVLPDLDAAALELHLASCAACRLAAERLGHAWCALAPLHQVSPAPDDWTRLETALEARSRRWMPLWMGLQLAAVRAVAAGVLAGMAALGATGGMLLARAALAPRRNESIEAVAFAETLGDLPWGSPAAELAEPLLAQSSPEERQ